MEHLLLPLCLVAFVVSSAHSSVLPVNRDVDSRNDPLLQFQPNLRRKRDVTTTLGKLLNSCTGSFFTL